MRNDDIYCEASNKIIENNDECIDCPLYDECGFSKPYPPTKGEQLTLRLFILASLIITSGIIYLFVQIVKDVIK